MLDPEGRALRDELVAVMQGGAGGEVQDSTFDRLARRVFAYNFDQVPTYAAYCRARGRTPGTLGSWADIPAVPTAAFKETVLLATGATADRVFRTSGTTLGRERRGQHHVADLSLYRESLRATFATFMLPDRARLAFLSLVPRADLVPDSSLAFMVDDLGQHFGAAGSRAFAGADRIDFDGLDAAVADAAAEQRPVLLLGTSAAFIHWLDRLAADGVRHRLPDGSRLMDTGGYKGRSRQVDPAELREEYRLRLGLAPDHCINEYGMTEMLSQYYDRTLRDGGVPAGMGGPPWVRSVAVDPETLEPLPPGRRGLLRHLDLANLGSVAAIQTEDVGRVDEGGLILEGRVAGAQPRGCSIAMDLLLADAR
jgi:hypothetical protein